MYRSGDDSRNISGSLKYYAEAVALVFARDNEKPQGIIRFSCEPKTMISCNKKYADLFPQEIHILKSKCTHHCCVEFYNSFFLIIFCFVFFVKPPCSCIHLNSLPPSASLSSYCVIFAMFQNSLFPCFKNLASVAFVPMGRCRGNSISCCFVNWSRTCWSHTQGSFC